MKKNIFSLDQSYLLDILPSEKMFSSRLAENLAWYSANPINIGNFYSRFDLDFLEDVETYFWKNAPKDKIKCLHTGLPSLISDRMSKILFSAGMKIMVEVCDNNQELDDIASKIATERLMLILEDNCIEELYDQGANLESWCGHLFAKLSVDTTLSKFPIIEFLDLRNAEMVRYKNRTVELIFKNYINKNDNQSLYIHYEIYSKDENGDAIIANKLVRKTSDQEEELPLDSLSETSELAPHVKFVGIKEILALDKANKLPNKEFPDCPYGMSDYFGAYSSFDALDEIYSENINEVRRHKTIRYIPKTMVPVAKNGESTIFNQVDIDFIAIKNKDQVDSSEITYTQIPDKTDDFLKKFNLCQATAINLAGLSPMTLGVACPASEALQEQQKTTLETRQAKIRHWKPFLEKLFFKVLELDSWIANQQGKQSLDINYNNCKVKVTFNDYKDI